MIKIDSSLHTIPYNSSNRGMEAGAAYPEEDSGLIPDDEDIFDDPASETAETPSPFSRRTVLPDPPWRRHCRLSEAISAAPPMRAAILPLIFWSGQMMKRPAYWTVISGPWTA